MAKTATSPTKADPATAGRSKVSRRQLPQRDPVRQRAAVGQALGHDTLVQTKLRVSQPGDAQEVEADRVADAVMREPSGKVPASFPTASAASTQAARKCLDCEDQQVQRKAKKDRSDEEEQVVHTKRRNNSEGGPPVAEEQLPALGQLSGGHAIPDVDRQFFENRFGRDFSEVRIHTDANMTEQLSARAFTAGKHVVFAPGEYQAGQAKSRHLLAHELAHVVQQKKHAPGKIQRKASNKSATPANAKTEEIAPETVDIKGQTALNLSETNRTWFEGGEGQDAKRRPKGKLRIKLGDLAAGVVDVHYRKGGIKLTKKQALDLKDPLTAKIGDNVPALRPQLILKTDGVNGYVGLMAKEEIPSQNDLVKVLQPHLGHLLPPGFNPGKIKDHLVNGLAEGELCFGLQGLALDYGSIFSGELELISVNGVITKTSSMTSSMTTSVKGLEEGNLDLERNAQGVFSGQIALKAQLSEQISGNVTVRYDGKQASGEGMIGYQGEKFSGQVQLKVLPQAKAAELEASKKAAEGGDQPPAPAPGVIDNQIGDFVVFGDGELDFAFTDWLTGKAQVIITPLGHLTVIGEIKPQEEVLLFEAKPWDKSFAKIEARAVYGLPVVGNLFIGASLEPGAFATFGEGKIHQIAILGTYSTDPTVADNFSIQATLNINAAAGGKLRGSVFAGVEILDHDLKAGGAITGLLGIQGYLDATPVIGYREQVSQMGQDKKGEFYMKGDAEIAAQAFIGLQGELFVEVDAPMWSPLPDKRWTWPLAGKTWPLGKSIGVGAEMEYVFGSGKAPDFKMKPAEFDTDKFTTDLFEGRTSSAKDAKALGKWREKTPKDKARGTQNGEPPKGDKANEKTEVEGKGAQGSGPAPKKGAAPKKATDQSKTAEGKTVAQLKREATERDIKKQPNMKGAKAAPNPNVSPKEKEAEANKQKAAVEVDKVLKTGIRRDDLLSLLADLKKRYKLKAARIQRDDDVELVNSPPLERPAKAWCNTPKADVSGQVERQDLKGRSASGNRQYKVGVLETKSTDEQTMMGAVQDNINHLPATIQGKKYPWMDKTAARPKEAAAGLFYKSKKRAQTRDSAMTLKVGKFGKLEHEAITKKITNSYEGGHLVGHQFGGPEIYPNLVPQMGNAINRGLFGRIEKSVKANLGGGITGQLHVYFEVRPNYGAPNTYQVSLTDAANALYNLSFSQTRLKKSRNSSSRPLATISFTGVPNDNNKAAVIAALKANSKTSVNDFAAVQLLKKDKLAQVIDYEPKQPLPANPKNQQPDLSKPSRILNLEKNNSGEAWDVFSLKSSVVEGFQVGKVQDQEAKDQAAASSDIMLTLPKRIPKRTDIRVVLSGIADPKLANLPANKRSNIGGTIDVANCIIVAEGQTVKKEAVTQGDVANKVKANSGPKKEVKVVSEYVINHNTP